MTQSSTFVTRAPAPRLPRLLALPLGLIPEGFHSRGLALVLDRIFAPAQAAGELDFLVGKTFGVRVEDARLSYHLRFDGQGFRTAQGGPAADTEFSGNLYELLLMATGREDADTLFFQRRLRMRGDTELGLAMKNFLDARETPLLPKPLASPLIAILERIG